MTLFGASYADKGGFKRLTAEVAQRLGFNGKFTIQGSVSKTRQETKRALKQGKTAGKEGYAGVVDRDYKDKRYSDRMDMNGVDLEVMKEWGELLARREIAPLPAYTLSYIIRAKKCARWDYTSSTAGGSNMAPHQWDYPELDHDGNLKKVGGGRD